jgi:hypothetical protein
MICEKNQTQCCTEDDAGIKVSERKLFVSHNYENIWNAYLTVYCIYCIIIIHKQLKFGVHVLSLELQLFASKFLS